MCVLGVCDSNNEAGGVDGMFLFQAQSWTIRSGLGNCTL